MGDAYEVLIEGFRTGLDERRQAHDSGAEFEVLDGYDVDDLFEAGRRAAATALVPLTWRQRLGETGDTVWVCEQLEITRQAVAKKVAAGQLLALPAGRTRAYPLWQFEASPSPSGPAAAVRPEVALLLAAFRDRYPEVRPLEVAAWARTPQSELDDGTPEAWLDKGGPTEPLLDAARRAAGALAQ